MKKIMLFVILSFLLVSHTATQAQDAMFKALFMYNFAKNIEWPPSYREGDFVIGVLGNTTVEDELKRIAEKKKAGNQTIVVSRFSSVADIDKCHMLYVPPNKSNQLASILTHLRNKPTVIITDKEGLARQGACINYVTVNGDQKFEINRKNIEDRGLKITAFLMELGIVIQ